MDYECLALGDRALLLQFGSCVDDSLSAHVQAAASAITKLKHSAVTSIVPAYAAVALELDLIQLERNGGEAELRSQIEACLSQLGSSLVALDSDALIEIPTRYGGDDGPDLSAVSALLKCPESEIIRLHTAPTYRVAQVGFQPGFPYLLGLHPSLHLARRTSPRARVPAGSVAIGGAQTGIYPQASPGGWHLLGRTDLRLFDASRLAPALLVPGNRVRFVAINS